MQTPVAVLSVFDDLALCRTEIGCRYQHFDIGTTLEDLLRTLTRESAKINIISTHLLPMYSRFLGKVVTGYRG